MPKSGIGGPVTLATGEGWATALVVDDRSLYFNTRRCVGGSCFLSRDNCSTMRVRKSGGMSEIFVRGGAGGLSLDSKAIFVGGVSRENSLLHVDKGTGAVGDMRDGSLPESIAVLGDSLVWTTNEPAWNAVLQTAVPGAADESKRAYITVDDVAGPVAIDGDGVFVRTKSSILRADLKARQITPITSVTSAGGRPRCGVMGRCTGTTKHPSARYPRTEHIRAHWIRPERSMGRSGSTLNRSTFFAMVKSSGCRDDKCVAQEPCLR